MYHTVFYWTKSGYITKEKHKSPPPPNEMAMYINKGFDNWRVGRAWIFYLHQFYEKFEQKRIDREKKKAGGELNA